MHIIGLGDSHFEEGPRFGECVRVHEWVRDMIVHEKPDLVVHTGDVFEKRSTHVERMAAIDSFFAPVAEVCEEVVIRGNHEPGPEVPLFERIKGRYPIHAVEDPTVLHFENLRHGPLSMAVIPWPRLGSRLDENGTRTELRNLLLGLGQQLRQRDGYQLAIGHLLFNGAKTSAGQPLMGGGIGLDPADTMFLRCPLIGGHIHASQVIHDPFPYDTPSLYPGSPYRTAFGEHEAKRIVSMRLARTGDMKWEFIETPARAMYLVTGHYDPELGRILYADPGDVRDADVRLEYTVAREHEKAAAAHFDLIDRQWKDRGAAIVKPAPAVTVVTRARAPEVAAAKDLPEKIAALWKSNGTELPEAQAMRVLAYAEDIELAARNAEAA